MTIPNAGKCFPTARELLDYLDDITFRAWKPRFVTMHHTGSPSLATWRGYKNRRVPITDAQWMRNLAEYYGKPQSQGGPAGGPWSAGPHFFFTPDNYCVLSPPDRRGVHAVSFNANSWGVECVGDFDSEAFTPELAERYAAGLAALHVAAGLSPGPFVRGLSGLHFHRDDPRTNKTCPGGHVQKDMMINLTASAMAELTGTNAHDDDEPLPPVSPTARTGTVVNVMPGDALNVRDEPSGRSPVVGKLGNGQQVEIVGEVQTGGTLWYKLVSGDFVSAAYVRIRI